MDLSSALEVRNEIDSFFARRTRGTRRRKFALGVAIRNASDYKVAVRAAVEKDFSDTDRLAVENLTQSAGDLDVKFIGEISAASAHALLANRGIAIGACVAHSQ